MKYPYRCYPLGLALLITSCGSSELNIIDTVSSPDNTSAQTTELVTTDPSILPRVDVRELDTVYPYRSESPYAAILRQCALVKNPELACSLETLPFLAQVNPIVTRETILNRLLVTHSWMGERFETLLTEAPDNIIPLFGSITSIVIGSTVRPSYYWAGTGAIHLDPGGLWLSVEEKANVAVTEDFRSDFGDDLQFWFFESMRLGNKGVGKYYSLTDTTLRPYEDIKYPIYRLLYHELAHAVDYLSTESVPTLLSSVVPAAALLANENFFISPRFTADLPLNSLPLLAVGQVSFHGVDATSIEASYTPAYLGNEMEGDGSAKLYAYSSIREDFSTAFTLAMMKLSFDIDLYAAFVNKPADLDNYDCGDLLVGWGQKNRLADPLVSARAKWAMESVYGVSPGIDEFFTTRLGQTEPMIAGVNWCDNRDGTLFADSTDASQSISPEVREHEIEQLRFERRATIH